MEQINKWNQVNISCLDISSFWINAIEMEILVEIFVDFDGL